MLAKAFKDITGKGGRLMRLQDRIAIITGGAGGIGKETAELFAREGARVAIWDFDDSGSEVAAAIEKDGGQAIFVKTDVSKAEEVEQALEKTEKDLGPVEILINNAGITRDGFLTKMDLENWQKVMDVNLTGIFNCARAVAPGMMERQSGVIINSSSVVGVYGNVGQTNYSATKSGVIGMTKTWSKELGKKGVRVNAVAPGFVATPMTDKVPEKILDKMKGSTPLGRLGQPRDIAQAYLFLASEEASFVNGAVLQVDGGLVL